MILIMYQGIGNILKYPLQHFELVYLYLNIQKMVVRTIIMIPIVSSPGEICLFKNSNINKLKDRTEKKLESLTIFKFHIKSFIFNHKF